jgi:hypothetical protein
MGEARFLTFLLWRNPTSLLGAYSQCLITRDYVMQAAGLPSGGYSPESNPMRAGSSAHNVNYRKLAKSPLELPICCARAGYTRAAIW